ncbi:MAG: tyrosine-type recombinase/integrase, partial [Planctomycetota bacterium]|jgi:integrase
VIRVEPDGDWLPKNGEARVIPVCPQLEAILREASRRSLYVLNTCEGKPYHGDGGNPLLWWFKRLYRRAGIGDWKDLGVHTLRHTFCSRLAQLGVRSELRAAIVGHRTLAMQNLYTHTEQEDALDAGRRLRYG